jgi:hypothetical protein
LFHAFVHWEYTLFRAIEEEIAGLETLNREKLLKKKKAKNLIDTNDPDYILELLDKKKMAHRVCVYIAFVAVLTSIFKSNGEKSKA